MYVMQATFKAKPGEAQALADKITAAAGAVASDERVKGWRVLIDHVADFWTVVFEASFEDLDDYFAAGHSVEELVGRAESELRRPPEEEQDVMYEATPAGLC